jgi:hypothetical protein
MVATRNAFNSHKHQWGRVQGLSEIDTLDIPAATNTYQPVPHGGLYRMWSERLERAGYRITDEEHWVTNSDDVFLSKVSIESSVLPSGLGFKWQTALINSYNRQVAIKTAMGANVFVCTNGCLSAEFMMRTKHTGGVWERLNTFVTDSVRTVEYRASVIFRQFERYNQTDASSDRQVDHVVCEAYRQNIIPASGIGQVLDHWHTPEHAEFKPRNVWSLYNAFTSYDRGRSMFDRTARTNRLHSLLNREYAIAGDTPQTATNALLT